MVELLKSHHGGVVKELESFGVKFNEVDGDAFRSALAPLYIEQDGMTTGVFKCIFSVVKTMNIDLVYFGLIMIVNIMIVG